MNDELKKCPFCGEYNDLNDYPILDNHGNTKGWCYECGCGASGPMGEGAMDAWRKWNTRPIEDDLRAKLKGAKDG